MIDLKRLREDASAYAAEVCSINLADLDTTLSQHASLYAYVAAAYEHARVEEARLKWLLEHTRAAVFNSIREEEPGIAIGKAEKLAMVDPRAVEAAAAYYAAANTAGSLRALMNGLEHRRDMLIQISARDRQERRL